MSNNRNNNPEQLAVMFKALSNPNRIRLFLRLVRCCRGGRRARTPQQACACVGELGESLNIAPSTVSHHMKELHHAGLVHMQRRGQNVDCWVDPKPLKQLARFLNKAATS
ncbi:hypothetical protein LCGC14_0333860 [marine sediment metagenome]|uniref:HTH arsR-type domain-containing protein n=1 Tax=marine sediment metagenome TaxID=412755 RepID=A0A0F9TYP0_9ZZZZ|nr:transcriptional regulator [Phycisphaerae bacterium]HDZ44086.1 transcriptional regulator [Phycisphaerae bacterium]